MTFHLQNFLYSYDCVPDFPIRLRPNDETDDRGLLGYFCLLPRRARFTT